jgi:predicted DsbA family dithiol-disulfide isomerase
MKKIAITIYTDIICPWCLIGQTRLDHVLSNYFSDLDVEIEHQPVILVPDCPPSGLKIADLLLARGMDPVAVQSRTEKEAQAVGLTSKVRSCEATI